MKYTVFLIGFLYMDSAQPFALETVITLVQTIGPYIVPGYTLKRLFDKNDEVSMRHDGGSSTATRNCPVTVSENGKAFIGCMVNGTMHMDSMGYTTAPDATASDSSKMAGGIVDSSVKACLSSVERGYFWIKNHKIATLGAVLGASYIYSLAKVAYYQKAFKNSSSWGAWHAECVWEALEPHEQARLREELLIEVRKRYPLVNDAVPIHCFMNDVEAEISLCTRYMALIARIQKLDALRKMVTDRCTNMYCTMRGIKDQQHLRNSKFFEYCGLARWLLVDEQSYALCLKRREHLIQLKAFYAEWLTTVRAIFKDRKV